MKEISIAANARQTTGKGPARQSRMQGKLPGVVYGPEKTPLSVYVAEREFRAAMKAAAGSSSIFTLNIDGQPSKVLVREIQRDPVSSKMLHVDFHAISMTKPINLSIPVHITGISKGVKAEGGIQNLVLRELEISCLPSNIPDFVSVDVSELSIGDSIHVRDLMIPNVTVLEDKDSTVVTISAPTVIKVEAPTAEAVAEAAAAEAAAAAPAAAGAAGAKAGAAPAGGAKAGAAPAGAKKDEKKSDKK